MALGLNIVVGFAGLLDLGYVAFYALGAYSMGWLASDFYSTVNGGKGIYVSWGFDGEACPGIHLNFLLILIVAIILCALSGHADRPADAATARRLHRDRDAGVRRDRLPRSRPTATRSRSAATRSS